MKIQLKRSNVLEGGAAKAPTAGQMEYGELAVNYNETDPVIFIKDNSNNIIRLTNSIPINDGQINVEVVSDGGLLVTGDNATANQATDTTRTLSVDTTWLTSFINTSDEIKAVYLSKVNDDTAAGNITFTNKIGVGSANTGTDALTVTGDASITGLVTSNAIDTQSITAVTYNLEALPALQPVP